MATKRNRQPTFPYIRDDEPYEKNPNLRVVDRFQIDLVNMRPEDEDEWGFINLGIMTPSTYDYIEGTEGTTPFAWMSLTKRQAEELAIALLYGLTNGTFEKPEPDIAESLKGLNASMVVIDEAVTVTNTKLKELAKAIDWDQELEYDLDMEEDD